jgi:dTDP-glucose pyrophosphorylase
MPYKNTIKHSATVKQALQQLNTLANSLTLFVLNNKQQVIGTLTDGDIRRGLLDNKSIHDLVIDFMFKDFRYLKQGEFITDNIKQYRKLGIRLIPLLDENLRIIRIFDLHEKKSILPIDAVIMAGGRGSRLSPLTDKTPKPLLKVGNKPIIEYNIDRLNSYGISNLHITIKYLGQQLIDYFADGANKQMFIQYVEENDPLGTIGAVGLIKHFPNETILVMNSDLLTNINFEDLYLQFKEQNADMMVAAIPYEVKVPYAILEIQNEAIISFKEKPTYTHYANAGIYLIKKSMLDFIPKNAFYNATDLLETLIKQGYKVGYYPILGYWLDIGKPADFKKAQEDIKHLNL